MHDIQHVRTYILFLCSAKIIEASHIILSLDNRLLHLSDICIISLTLFKSVQKGALMQICGT